MSKVLVVFQANTEQVEQLALAVAVGAVEAEALIRLRRLAAADAPEVGHKAYGRLQAGDLMWANAIVVVLEDELPNFEELDPMLELLSEIERQGVPAWTFRGDGLHSPMTAAQSIIEKALLAAGFTFGPFEQSEAVEDKVSQMKLVGRTAAVLSLEIEWVSRQRQRLRRWAQRSLESCGRIQKKGNNMLTIRRSNERGHADHGWLNSHHTFSFANYNDPAHMGYRSLRVINEDRVAQGRGFGAHAHRDMEILSYVLLGKLAHKDSMGHTEVLGPNEIQKMSAGSGVVHSEFNGSETEPVHFLQIWIEPNPKSRGTAPSYEQMKFAAEEKQNRFKLLASPTPAPGAAQINQDAKVSVAELDGGRSLEYALASDRYAWLHVIHGEVSVNGTALSTGDAVAVEQEQKLDITAQGAGKSEILLFDLQ